MDNQYTEVKMKKGCQGYITLLLCDICQEIIQFHIELVIIAL